MIADASAAYFAYKLTLATQSAEEANGNAVDQKDEVMRSVEDSAPGITAALSGARELMLGKGVASASDGPRVVACPRIGRGDGVLPPAREQSCRRGQPLGGER